METRGKSRALYNILRTRHIILALGFNAVFDVTTDAPRCTAANGISFLKYPAHLRAPLYGGIRKRRPHTVVVNPSLAPFFFRSSPPPSPFSPDFEISFRTRLRPDLPVLFTAFVRSARYFRRTYRALFVSVRACRSSPRRFVYFIVASAQFRAIVSRRATYVRDICVLYIRYDNS